jgi:methionyl-tRNA synthetase
MKGAVPVVMKKKTFYITTAIDYVNQKPHLGTAYEKIGADVMARYKRMNGFDTFFLMGNDEHSANVANEAKKKGLDTLEYCRGMSGKFKRVWKLLNISFDDFIHTTEERHVESVKKIFAKIDDGGYIYKGRYSGFYCESCEEFISEKDLVDGLCPKHKQKPKEIDEENYFFALSKFEKPLLEYIEKNPEFIRPRKRYNEIVNVIKSGLEDISISRIGKDWGIPLPTDKRHVIYVWFDALTSYISALNYGRDGKLYEKYWPADLHVIGKDITRFHCIIWPAMLMAAEVPLPKSVFAHGFLSLSGEKMSKTRGNVLDPESIEEKFGADGLRYLLLREVPFDKDGDISMEVLINRYNAELANELGNLFSRTASMIVKYLDGNVEKGRFGQESTLYYPLAEALSEYKKFMEEMYFSRALDSYWRVIQRANRFIEEEKPWELAKDESGGEKLQDIFRQLIVVLITSGVVLLPFMPGKMKIMLEELGGKNITLDSLPPDECGIEGLTKPDPLFPRIEKDI